MDESTSITPDYETIEFRNPFYSKPDGSAIDMEVNDPRYGWQPFTATPNDAEPHGLILFDRAVKAGGIAAYLQPNDEERRAAMPNVSARQLRLTLVRNGFSLSSIDAAIASLPEGQQKDEALIEWEYAHEFQRISPTLNSIAAALGIDQTEVDLMWRQALSA